MFVRGRICVKEWMLVSGFRSAFGIGMDIGIGLGLGSYPDIKMSIRQRSRRQSGKSFWH